ncbi:hypothetical protein CSPX01_08716, partial [Colletotrichum filicis]
KEERPRSRQSRQSRQRRKQQPEGRKEEEPLARTQEGGTEDRRQGVGHTCSIAPALHLPAPHSWHSHTAGALAGVSPSCLCSHAPSCSWAGWLLVCCYYGLLLDGWLPPSFEPDLPGQSCLTTSSNQIGLDGVQGTAWGCTSQWPEVGGVSVVKLTLKHNHDTEQPKVRTSRHGNGRTWTIRWCTRETGTARESLPYLLYLVYLTTNQTALATTSST